MHHPNTLHTGTKMAVFWDVVLCSLAETDISEVLTASIIKAVIMMK
jgi:hypothetical protein